MTLPVLYQPAARAEFVQAVEDYGPGLEEAVERCVSYLGHFPKMGGVVDEERCVRRIVVAPRKYKFSLLYRVMDEHLEIVALAWPGKRPGYWHKRV